MPETRLLLVDVLNANPHNQLYGEAFPFVQAWASAAGADVLLVAVTLSEGARALPGLAPPLLDEDEARIARAAADFGATHALFTLPPGDSLRRALADIGGDPAIEDIGDRFVAARRDLVPWLSAWLGLEGEPEGLLPDRVVPDYATTTLGAVPTPPPAVRVVAGSYAWRPLVALRSPFFKPDETDSNYMALAAASYPYEIAPVDLALRQIEAAARTLPPDLRSREFVLYGADVLRHADDFAARVTAIEPSGATFLLSVDPDAVVAAQEAIERALPLLEAAGHRLFLANVGPWNFSAAECERVEAPVTPDTWFAVDERLRDWEGRFADTFACMRTGGFGIALYTPWTTLDDLRANLDAARTVDPRSLSYVATSRFRIVPGSPVARRAAADGLLTDCSEPAVFGVGADETAPLPERGVPWRFRDPRVARVHQLLVRMLPDEGRPPPDDPYYGVGQRLRGALDDTAREDPLRILALLLDAVGSLPDDAGIRAALDACLSLVGKPDVFIGLEDDPEEGEGPPPEPDDEAARDAKLLDAYFASLGPEGIARLQGYRLASVVDEFDTEGHRVIAITLRLGDERLVANLLPRRAVRGSFAFTTRYALCYHRDTPIDTRDKELAVQALAEMVEEATTTPE